MENGASGPESRAQRPVESGSPLTSGETGHVTALRHKMVDFHAMGQILNQHTNRVTYLRVQKRSRACDSPPPFNGGLPCDGSTSQERTAICKNLSPCPVDGGVSEWGEWDSPRCPTCGENVTGISLRLRPCDNPVPAYGGSFCIEPVQQTMVRSCNVSHCPVDGGFTEWSEWDNPDCPVTCGREAQKVVSRNRSCTEPPPQFGGVDCAGPSEESENRSCNHTECPIDGGFTEWSEWDNPDCPVTCGREAQKIVSRNRSCTEPPAQFGGVDCAGPSEESENRSCNHTECPIDGGFTEWSEWDNPDCPVTCGREAQKVVSRNRSCTEPPPQFGGVDCAGPSEESENRSCNHTECPIDGGFTEWSEWDNPDCPVTCGREAQKVVSRNRSCTEPPPQFGGVDCAGPSEESENRSCNHTECPIDGGFTEWSEWDNPDCPVTCGREAQKIVSRNRSCTEPPPQFGGVDCAGPSEESENRSCNHTECPIDGGFTEWSEWDNPDCPVTCGREAQKVVSRNRSCTEPPPQFGGVDCAGPSEESENRSCNHTECPIDGGFTEWSEWDNPDCPVTCGREAQKVVSRNRSCTEPPPQFGGVDCAGPSEESENRSCNHTECPIAGGVTEWNDWSTPQCGESCGKDILGYVVRIRTCTNPPPTNNGPDCTDHLQETGRGSCNLPPCSSNDNVTTWTDWSEPSCTVSCGKGINGTATRTRECIMPSNGTRCIARLLETDFRECNLPVCPVDGGLSNWTSWSIVPCPVTCGVNAMTNQSRYRECNAPAPDAGGKNCTGPLMETSQTLCSVPACSGEDNVSDWTQWSSPVCTAACGPGEEGRMERTRNCVAPADNISCTALLIETQMGNCGLPKCPVDGGLSNWTSWSIVPCPVTCGVNAMTNQSRYRECNAPAPDAGGKNCTGPLMETSQTLCSVPACSGEDNVSDWTQWSSPVCTAACGPGEEGRMERTRNCVAPADNISCTVLLIETQMGNCGLPKCPVDGGLSNWTSWSIVPCPVTCGVNAMTNQSRYRVCNAPAPDAGGKNCTGPLMETSQTLCSVPACSGEDNVSDWTQWSSPVCTAACGPGEEGRMERTRNCVAPADNISCTALLIETQMGNCGLPKCPVDGGLSNWTSWSIIPCPVTCGVNAMTNQSRYRECNAPAPDAGGKNCTGPLMETSQTLCSVPACSGEDNVSDWTQWSSPVCSAACGPGEEGRMERTRNCVAPADNISCTALLIETQMGNCGLPKCPVDGGLSNWTSWSIVPCPVTCGVNAMTNQSRYRECNAPAPDASGKNCTGPLMETSQTLCSVPACSGEDNVSDWTQWSSPVCTAACGPGEEGRMERTRNCVAPADNISCTALLIETQMGNCGLPKCPGKCAAAFILTLLCTSIC
ncbi:SCO-spondin-like [Haliotis asinina]|uniref:SCO-spondin-like n=1 Tax=Haliotis asinina TaxID=109174 RepID=UPI003531A68D